VEKEGHGNEMSPLGIYFCHGTGGGPMEKMKGFGNICKDCGIAIKNELAEKIEEIFK
jgi:hypothetical protein